MIREPDASALPASAIIARRLAAHLEQVRKEGHAKIFREKMSGVQSDRRGLLKLLKAVGPGDMATVT